MASFSGGVGGRICVAAALGVLCALLPWSLGGEAATNYYEPRYFETQPGVLFYLFQNDSLWEAGTLSVRHHATADYLTPPVAMEFSFPAVEGAAGFDELDIDQAVLPVEEGEERTGPVVPADAIGVSFWVKGDGSAGAGRVELRSDYRQPGGGYDFALADRKWHRVLIKWADLTPACDISEAGSIGFGLKEGSARPARYIVDALRFVKSDAEEADLARLAAGSDDGDRREIAIPTRPSPGACAYNKGALARSRAKIHRGEGAKWLAYGDSVTVPVQMWNIPQELQRGRYAYYASAARDLEAEFGGKIDIAVDAVGGRQLNEDFGSLAGSLIKEKPDVLILFSGDTIANYEVLMRKVLDAAKASGAEVLVVIPTYDPTPLRVPAFDWLRRYCIENGVACADARSYLLGTPREYWGDTISNPSHPNAVGHRLIGQVVAEMFR